MLNYGSENLYFLGKYEPEEETNSNESRYKAKFDSILLIFPLICSVFC